MAATPVVGAIARPMTTEASHATANTSRAKVEKALNAQVGDKVTGVRHHVSDIADADGAPTTSPATTAAAAIIRPGNATRTDPAAAEHQATTRWCNTDACGRESSSPASTAARTVAGPMAPSS